MEELKKSLYEKIENLDIADFLKFEVLAIFEELHHYKLQNVLKNISKFEDFLLILDKKLSLSLKNISKGVKVKQIEESLQKDFEKIWNFYLSKEGQNIVDKERFFCYLEKFGKKSLQFQKLTTAVKGFLLLSMSEFMNGTWIRLENSSYFWKIENKKLLAEIS